MVYIASVWTIGAGTKSDNREVLANLDASSISGENSLKFRVMTFGLKNPPAVFQRLMQQAISCLNLEDGPRVCVGIYRRHYHVLTKPQRSPATPTEGL